MAEIRSLEDYVEWMKGFFGPVPDARYEVKAFARDPERRNVTVVATLHGTNTGDRPVPPTGNTVAADYVYVMQFDGDLISHVLKVWNAPWSLRQLGWT